MKKNIANSINNIEEEIIRLVQQQEWHSESLSDLAMCFIMSDLDLAQSFLAFLRRVAKIKRTSEET